MTAFSRMDMNVDGQCSFTGMLYDRVFQEFLLQTSMKFTAPVFSSILRRCVQRGCTLMESFVAMSSVLMSEQMRSATGFYCTVSPS